MKLEVIGSIPLGLLKKAIAEQEKVCPDQCKAIKVIKFTQDSPGIFLRIPFCIKENILKNTREGES